MRSVLYRPASFISVSWVFNLACNDLNIEGKINQVKANYRSATSVE
jgi:hypothetical protein